MSEKIQLTDSREVGHIYCIHCRANHMLSDLRKELQGETDLYICPAKEFVLAKSKSDGRVVPLLGDAG